MTSTRKPTPDPTTDLGIVARLGIEGITAEIENTGGGVMVVTVPAREPGHGIVAVTYDGDAYNVGTYPGASWWHGEGEDEAAENVSANRRPADVEGMVSDVADARDLLATLAVLTPAQAVQASIAWQYRTHVEEPAGYVELVVPGGAILVSVDHPTGVYGGFYLATGDGYGDKPSPVMTGRGPLTFAGAGVWDVSRIVSALRGEHGDPMSAVRILGDYMG
jgi:hypothetical protein